MQKGNSLKDSLVENRHIHKVKCMHTLTDPPFKPGFRERVH